MRGVGSEAKFLGLSAGVFGMVIDKLEIVMSVGVGGASVTPEGH